MYFNLKNISLFIVLSHGTILRVQSKNTCHPIQLFDSKCLTGASVDSKIGSEFFTLSKQLNKTTFARDKNRQ